MKRELMLLSILFLLRGFAGAACPEAETLFNSGKAAEAEAALGDDLSCGALRADIFVALGKMTQAEEAAFSAFRGNPSDYRAALALARLYSWTGRLGDSAAYYEKAAALKPGEYLPELEKARVLAWDRRDDGSDKAYDAAFSRSGLEWIKEEKEGKLKMRGGRPWTALARLEKAAALEPSDAEALFDLAQFYSNSGLYHEAAPYYKKLSEASPYNGAAAKARAKNSSYMEGLDLRADFSLWAARGADRMTDVEYFNSELSAGKFISPKVRLSAGAGYGHYLFTGSPSADELSGKASLEYRPGKEGGAGAEYSAKKLNRSLDSRNDFSLFFWRGLRENLYFSASYGRENLVNSAAVVAAGLDLDSFRTRLSWNADGALSAGADYRAGSVTGGNNMKLYGADASYYFSREPSAFYTAFRYERLEYAESSALYFAPAGYDLYALTAGYKVNFGPDGIYYGARNRYFEAKCRAAYDTTPYLSLNPSFLLNLELSGGAELRAGWSLTSSHYYRDNYYSLSLGKAF